MRDPAETFRNLIPCDCFAQPFLDRYAQFGVTFEVGRAMGPGMMQTRSAAMTAQPADCLLGLWVLAGESWVPVVRQSIRHLPWAVSEEGAIDLAGAKITVTAEHIFVGPRVLATRFRFVHDGPREAGLSFGYLGVATGDRFGPGATEKAAFGLDPAHPKRENWIQCGPCRVSAGMSDPTGILPQPSFRIRCRSADGLRTACSDQVHWMWGEMGQEVRTTEPRSLQYGFLGSMELAAGSVAEHLFTISQDVTTFACPHPPGESPDPAELDFGKLLAGSERDFLARVGWESPPRLREPVLHRKFWRARWAVLRTGYQADGHGGAYGSDIASTCVPNNGGFTRNFFWDGLFTSAAVASFAPDFARGAIRTVFSYQDPENGYCPEHSYNYGIPGRGPLWQPQAPVATWAMERYLAANPEDEAFLADMYPRLLLNHRHWLEHADRDGDGLMEWQWGGQTADDSPLYDLWTGGKNGWLGPQASVHLNAFLHRDARVLAEFADRLGKRGDASEIRSRAARRHEVFMRLCHLPEERRFYDYCHLTRRHVRVRTFYLFWPIWAGMEVPDETKRDLIEKVLLDPKQFFGPVPFPSVAYDEPAYDENAYWRGKCWPHISYWLIEMLRQEGYREQAMEARKRLLGAWMRDPSFPENMRTDATRYEAHPQPDYNWGAAMALLLLGEPWPPSP